MNFLLYFKTTFNTVNQHNGVQSETEQRIQQRLAFFYFTFNMYRNGKKRIWENKASYTESEGLQDKKMQQNLQASYVVGQLIDTG